MMLDIVAIEDNPNPPVLTQKAEDVSFPLTSEDKAFIVAFKKKALEIGGVGLAAPQVGVAKKIIAISIDEEAKGIRNNAIEVVPLTILINPGYQPVDGTSEQADWEGCFSVRDVYGKIPRYDAIEYWAYTEEGEKISATARGFTARVLQHEIDHINGILIVDKLTAGCLFGEPKEMLPLRVQEFTEDQKRLYEKHLKRAKS